MKPYPTLGKIVAHDPALAALVDVDAPIERLARGLSWSEGPVWNRAEGSLLFSDIPRNTIYKWKHGAGLSVYMQPSGYTGVAYYGAEPGSNALTYDAAGRLTMCEHGDRRVSRLELRGGKKTLVDSYRGKRLNSPNDLVYRSDGLLYFTDPAYGLPDRYEDRENRELDFCGVYLLRPDGECVLLVDDLTHPNGVALSPDESVLYVSQSNSERAVWMAYPLKPDGTLGGGDVFYDATAEAAEMTGLPDGLTVDRQGNLFATGPGGVRVFTPEGRPLGRIDPGAQASNLCWGDDGSTLYITAHMYLCRVRTQTKGAGW